MVNLAVDLNFHVEVHCASACYVAETDWRLWKEKSTWHAVIHCRLVGVDQVRRRSGPADHVPYSDQVEGLSLIGRLAGTLLRCLLLVEGVEMRAIYACWH